MVLARCLATTSDPASGLEAFTEERFARTAKVIRQPCVHERVLRRPRLPHRGFGRLGQKEGRVTCWLRDTMIGLVGPLMGAGGLLKHATFDVGPLPK